MRPLPFVAFATQLLLLVSTASAGPNAGGTLLVHANEALAYCSDHSSYCAEADLSNCERVDSSVEGNGVFVWFVIAAFPEESSPRLSGVLFGIEYDAGVSLFAHGACGDFELPGPGWPQSSSGTALTWNAPRTDLLTTAYWFAGYNYDVPNPARFVIVPHPVQGGWFGDDSIPSILDPVTAYGALGFDRNGRQPCPIPLHGACCLSDGSCTVVPQSSCLGAYRGNGTDCDPDPCALTGACCFGEGACRLGFEYPCQSSGGIYQGDGSVCGPGACTNVGPCVQPIAAGPKTELHPSLGGANGVIQNPNERRHCGSLELNADGSYEGCYAWQYGGVVAPTYGAFAECYTTSGPQTICTAIFDFSQLGSQAGQCFDVYVWDDASERPGNVLCTFPSFQPGPLAFWPSFTRLVVNLEGCCHDGPFWIGYWGNWPGGFAPWYVGADLDGSGGCPLTNIAPGLGFPTGWTNVSQVWGPTQALGIGCELSPCGPVATQRVSWGHVKALYQGDESR